MGCDIHLYVERRDGQESPWVTADEWTEDKYEPGRMDVDYGRSFYHDRNYDLFAILAGVRNGRGFAGIKTGEGFVPISEPRGVPDDACPEYKKTVEDYGADGHSHSYHTLEQLLEYDWTQVSGLQGYVSLAEYGTFLVTGKPRSWCGDVGGGSSRKVSSADVDAKMVEVNVKKYDLHFNREEEIRRLSEALGGGTQYVHVQWGTRYYESASTFLSHVVPRLLRLGKPADVRVCFYFDN